MRVICIKQGEWRRILSRIKASGPKYGDECTVISKGIGDKGLPTYRFKEWSNDEYTRRHFIPLSSIDETEMERNYKTEKV